MSHTDNPWSQRDGADRIRDERHRQVEVEGYDPAKDRGRAPALFAAAAEYSIAASRGAEGFDAATLPVPFGWPWQAGFWKPSSDPIRNAEKAGALAAAGIDALLLEQQANEGDK